MQHKAEYILRKVADTAVVVPVGKEALNFNGMLTLNESGAFLYGLLDVERSREELLAALEEAYDAPAVKLAEDLDAFLKQLRDAGILTED